MKDGGYILLDDKVVGTTIQCVHCYAHFLSIPGSGMDRGYCRHCNGLLCGQPSCMKCVPAEAKLEYSEAIADEKQRVVNKLVSAYPDIVDLNFL